MDDRSQAAPNLEAAFCASHVVPTHRLATRRIFSLSHVNVKQVAFPSELIYSESLDVGRG